MPALSTKVPETGEEAQHKGKPGTALYRYRMPFWPRRAQPYEDTLIPSTLWRQLPPAIQWEDEQRDKAALTALPYDDTQRPGLHRSSPGAAHCFCFANAASSTAPTCQAGQVLQAETSGQGAPAPFLHDTLSDTTLQYTAAYVHSHSSKCSPCSWKDKLSVKAVNCQISLLCFLSQSNYPNLPKVSA